MNVFESLSISPAPVQAVLVASLGTLMLLMALSAHGALGRGRPRTRSALWNACALGMLSLPVALVVMPGMRSEKPNPIEGVSSISSRVVVEKESPRESRALENPVVFADEPVRQPVDWLSVLGWAYLVVTGWLLARLVVGMLEVERLRRRAWALESGPWKAAMERWRTRLGLMGPMRLASTDRVSVPVVLGWLRPAILVPEGLVKGASQTTIDAIVLHELAHVRRNDYFWNLLWKLAQAIYWPQPLVWLANRLASATRERACDALCVRWLDDVSGYRRTLIDLAAGLVRRPPVALGMTMARTSKLERRLADLDRGEGADSCRASGLERWSVGILFLAIALVGGLLKTSESPVLAGSMVVIEDEDEGKDRPVAAEKKTPDDVVKTVGPYRLVKPRMATVPHRIAESGTAEAKVAIGLYPKRSGYIKALNVDLGSKVKAGDVLAEIDAPEIATEVEQARAALEQARARLEQFQASNTKSKASANGREIDVDAARNDKQLMTVRLRNQMRELKQVEKLANQNVVSDDEVAAQKGHLDEAAASLNSAELAIKRAEAGVAEGEAEILVARADERAAEAALRVAEAGLKRAELMHAWTRIVSPCDGIVTERNINLGEYVRAASEGSSRPVLTVTDAKGIRMVVQVPDHHVPLLDVGDPADVVFTTIAETFKGEVSRIANVVNPETATMRCEIDLENPEGKIRPGMRGTVVITLDQHENVWAIPTSAVVTGGAGSGCYRLIDGRVVATEIHLGYSAGKIAEILDGLSPEDLVIENPDRNLKNGEPLSDDDPEPKDSGDGPDH